VSARAAELVDRAPELPAATAPNAGATVKALRRIGLNIYL
jgi:hypothetical protein